MKKYYKKSNIIGKQKIFDVKLFQKYDEPARKRIKEILKDFISDNPDKLKQDLIIHSEKSKYKYLELQVCANWIYEEFPHPYPYIFARKAAYEPDTLFLLLNKIMNKGYLFDIKVVVNDQGCRLKKFSRQFIFQIPWNRAMLVHTDKLDKETIELF